VSDELERNQPASDEGQDEGEDFEAHRQHGAGVTDEGDEGDDDVEAHRQHGGA
jgi:hypothetical protein